MFVTQKDLENEQGRLDTFAAHALAGGHPVADCYQIAHKLEKQRSDFIANRLAWQIDDQRRKEAAGRIEREMERFQSRCGCRDGVVFDAESMEQTPCPSCERHQRKLEKEK